MSVNIWTLSKMYKGAGILNSEYAEKDFEVDWLASNTTNLS